MKNFIIALCTMVGFLIGAWFVGHKKIQEIEFMVICTIFFFCIWNLMEVLELKKLAQKFTPVSTIAGRGGEPNAPRVSST